eukprot:TRINITY_DN3022_c7_g1_i1.p1 TRINITY_DN3022_c7_g1~~TRINITY_DN3022_c7_g1_i1.p1  ORF type:complete len:123 (+),score=10.84 TRINITY_DN3022_c7_g1_i1:137-505(+)
MLFFTPPFFFLHKNSWSGFFLIPHPFRKFFLKEKEDCRAWGGEEEWGKEEKKNQREKLRRPPFTFFHYLSYFPFSFPLFFVLFFIFPFFILFGWGKKKKKSKTKKNEKVKVVRVAVPKPPSL